MLYFSLYLSNCSFFPGPFSLQILQQGIITPRATLWWITHTANPRLQPSSPLLSTQKINPSFRLQTSILLWPSPLHQPKSPSTKSPRPTPTHSPRARPSKSGTPTRAMSNIRSLSWPSHHCPNQTVVARPSPTSGSLALRLFQSCSPSLWGTDSLHTFTRNTRDCPRTAKRKWRSEGKA